MVLVERVYFRHVVQCLHLFVPWGTQFIVLFYKSPGPRPEDACLLSSMEQWHIALNSLSWSWCKWACRVCRRMAGRREERKRGRDMPVLPLHPVFNAHWVTPQCRLCPTHCRRLREPLCQVRGFGDICHFSESPVAPLAAWVEGRAGGGPLPQERSSLSGRRKDMSEVLLPHMGLSWTLSVDL